MSKNTISHYVSTFLALITIQGGIIAGVWYLAMHEGQQDKNIANVSLRVEQNAETIKYLIGVIDQLKTIISQKKEHT